MNVIKLIECWSKCAPSPLPVFPLLRGWLDGIVMENLHVDQMRRRRMKRMDGSIYVWMGLSSKTFMLIKWGMLSVRSNIGRSMKDSASFMKISWICTRYQNWTWNWTRYQNWIWTQTKPLVKALLVSEISKLDMKTLHLLKACFTLSISNIKIGHENICWKPWASPDYLSTRRGSVPYTSPSPDREITLTINMIKNNNKIKCQIF